MLNDIGYAFKTLRQNPGFALTAIVSIALAIGANSAIFSYADGLLLRPLPVADASEVVSLRSVYPSVSSLPLRGSGAMSYPDYKDFRDNSRSFESLIAFDTIGAGLARDANDQPQLTLGYQVTGDFFRVLGIEPQLGRGFRPDEDEVPGRDAVIVLMHDLWKNEFGSDPSIIGRSVRLNDLDFTVVGVAPESFTGMDQFVRPSFFVPIMMAPKLLPSSSNLLTNRSRRELLVKGRLKPGVSIGTAGQEASAFAASLEQSYPDINRGFGATVSTEIQMRLLNYPLLGILVNSLFTISVVILLIACANIANLMLSRGRVRARELAVRLAIGASRRQLVRLLLAECLLIAVIGGALALIVADFAVGIFSTMEIPADVPVQPTFRLDPRVLWFTLLVSIASALLFGLVPALQSTRPNLTAAMKAGESTHARKRFFGRYALVILQIAGSMILLVFETQGRRSFDDALSGDPGFRRENRLTMRFDPSAANYTPPQTQQFYETLVERSLQVNGVKSAALTSAPPMTFDFGAARLVPEGYDFPPGRENVELFSYTVDHHYFETFAVRIIAGRGFRATDRADSPRVAVVNEVFAREYLGENPVGKRVRVGGREGAAIEIVGVTVTGKTMSLIEPPVHVVYFPLAQNPLTRMTLIAETYGDPAAMAGPLQEMVRSIDPNMPVFRVRTMENLFEGSTVKTLRMVGTIYRSASILGLVLALVGLYAVVSYQVTQRTREIGIRMALGAERRQVIQMFLQRSGAMSLAGVAIGLAVSMAAHAADDSQIMPSPYDPTLLVLVSMGMLLTTLVAAAIPARRASRIDPQKALRQD
jgi:putative ABC transport system permease protein